MAQVKFHKFVAALPAELEADAIYYVRAGAGFDIYVTNSSGVVVAYPLNVGGPGQAFFRAEPVTATAAGQTAFTVPGGYTPGAVIVSLNGATLPPADYTAADGATVTLGSGAGIVVGSVLLVYVLSAFEVADALPLLGTAADSERYAGLLPPPSDGKSYALKDGAWAEVEVEAGGSWGSITGTLTDQADLASALAAKAAASDIDFTIIYPNGGSEASPANISVSSRYVELNPFPGHRVLCQVEVLYAGEWGVPHFSNPTNTEFSGAHATPFGGDIVIQTARQRLITAPDAQGHPWGGGPSLVVTTPLPCRVLVWKVKGAIA